MKILAVDDERIALQGLTQILQDAEPEAEVFTAMNAETALALAQEKGCDIAFLDIQLHGSVHGLALAKQLKAVNPQVNLVFTTGYSEFMPDAFAMHASGYLMKPITAEKVAQELDNLRHPVPVSTRQRMQVHCFGNFEVFVDGEPVSFHYRKTKELFAYLVDRKGAGVSGNELCAVLWEDNCQKKAAKSYLRNLFADLKNSFAQLGITDVLIKQWNVYAVRPEAFWCDSYEFEKGNTAVINSFRNEYMTQYSWAEFALGNLTE